MTAVQQIILELEKELEDRKNCNGAMNSGVIVGLTNAKNIATKLLDKEQEIIAKAFDDGDFNYFYSRKTGNDFENGNEYYNEMFKKTENEI